MEIKQQAGLWRSPFCSSKVCLAVLFPGFFLSDCFRQESSTLDECAGQKGGWVGKQLGLVSHRVGLMERHSFEQQTGICEL